jgi:hypothetical protein
MSDQKRTPVLGVQDPSGRNFLDISGLGEVFRTKVFGETLRRVGEGCPPRRLIGSGGNSPCHNHTNCAV